MNPTKPVSLAGAIGTLMKLGYVLDLQNGFLVRGEEHRLDVVDDEVVVKSERGSLPWRQFHRTLRPQ